MIFQSVSDLFLCFPVSAFRICSSFFWRVVCKNVRFASSRRDSQEDNGHQHATPNGGIKISVRFLAFTVRP